GTDEDEDACAEHERPEHDVERVRPLLAVCLHLRRVLALGRVGGSLAHDVGDVVVHLPLPFLASSAFLMSRAFLTALLRSSLTRSFSRGSALWSPIVVLSSEVPPPARTRRQRAGGAVTCYFLGLGSSFLGASFLGGTFF